MRRTLILMTVVHYSWHRPALSRVGAAVSRLSFLKSWDLEILEDNHS